MIHPSVCLTRGMHVGPAGITRFSLLCLFAASTMAEDFSFETQPKIPFGPAGRGIVAGDFNQDGRIDLAVGTHDSIGIFLGDGSGGFASVEAIGIPSDVGRPRGLAVADFNRDGHPDLAVTTVNIAFEPNIVSVLLGDGLGDFAVPVDHAVGIEPLSLIAADLNHDGQTDLAASNRFSDSVSILFGKGNGDFETAIEYPTGRQPMSVQSADLDKDGLLDLVTADVDQNSVSVLLGTGGGAFAESVQFPAGSLPFDLAVGDLDGDANLDLGVPNVGSSQVRALLGSGDGTFAAPAAFEVGQFPLTLEIADLDLDGISDFIVSRRVNGAGGENTVSFLPGIGDGTFGPPVAIFENFLRVIAPPIFLTTDMNGDAKPDVAVYGRDGVGITLDEFLIVLLNTTPAPPAEQIIPWQVHYQPGGVTLNWTTRPPVAGVDVYRSVDLNLWEGPVAESVTNGRFADDGQMDPPVFYLLVAPETAT